MDLEIHMFDHLEIIGPKGLIDEEKIRSEMETKLLAYLFCHHKRNISIQELSEALWTEEKSKNPTGALKNLVYRLRNLIKEEWGYQSFILTGKGTYYLNPDISVKIDAEEFESCYRKAFISNCRDEKIRLYHQAITLYRGRFMPGLSEEYWVTSLSTYYHSLYLDAVKGLIRIYEMEKNYEAMVVVCSKAIEQDYLDEELHCYLLQAFIMQNKQTLAIEHYHKAINMLYDIYGKPPSKDMCRIHDQLTGEKQKNEMELKLILEELNRGDSGSGVLICEYRMFKNSYNQEVKRASRVGKGIYISLITLYTSIHAKKDGVSKIGVMDEGMEIIEFVLKNVLRKGDIVSKYSRTQYVIMLAANKYEAAQRVMDTIQERFDSVNRKKKVNMYYNLESINMRKQIPV